jgi:DNA polymerase II
MTEVRHVEAFLLSREWRDGDDGLEIILWARAESAPVRIRVAGQPAVMFVTRDTTAFANGRVPRALATLDGAPIDALYFRTQSALVEERERLRREMALTFESDVKPSDRFVMERFVTGGLSVEGPCRERKGILYFDHPKLRIRSADFRPKLSLLALDLETDDLDGPILSAALATADRNRVFVRTSASIDDEVIVTVPDERTLFTKLFEEINAIDPDVLCGWNVLDFDLTVLETRARALGLSFSIGRGGERGRIVPPSAPGRSAIARIPGRVVLDGISTLRTATWSFDRWSLEHVSRELLGRGKKMSAAGKEDPVAEIRRLHAEAPRELAEYNLEDCRLVLDIFAKTDLLAFAVERAHLSGLAMDRGGGSVAAFDHLYLPRLHRRGFVARDIERDVEMIPSAGGHVLDSVPGLHRDVLSFDFRSLYPSIIRTFGIDPLALAQPSQAPILPELITSLHEARARALAANDAPLSRAIKILMNSFYGVLGTPMCRFFDPRLPTAITDRGHELLARARTFFESQGGTVIYGDTDSIFVGGLDPARGPELAASLTRILEEELRTAHGIESQLELRFESHYERFLMPTTRGGDRGSKKRYAGTVRKADGSTSLVLRGLEAVRRDWTWLARRVQKELLRRVMNDEPFADWLLEITSDLRAGKLDEEIVLRDEEPSENPDYDVYIAKQLEPACDVVLPFVGTSFAKIAGKQTSMF